MRRSYLMLSAALLVLAAAPSATLGKVGPQRSRDPEARLNSRYLGTAAPEITTVTATVHHLPWWTVSDGRVRVHVLGIPWSAPAGMAWPQQEMLAIFDKSPLLIIPPGVKEGEDKGDARDMPNVGPVPADLVPRLQSAALKLGYPKDRYVSLHPILAGYQLVMDFRRANMMEEEGVLREIISLAETKPRSLVVQNAGVQRSLNGKRAFSGLNAQGARSCLEAALQEAEGGPEAARRAADAWRFGEIRKAADAPRGLDLCAFAVPGLAQVRATAIQDTAASITTVITQANLQLIQSGSGGRRSARPLNTDFVAVVYLRSLVAEGGVLDRLSAAGFRIENPKPAG